MKEITLKKATIADIETLKSIGRKTFYETFSLGNTEANMQKYLEEGFSTEKIAKELNEADSEFYLAMEGSAVIGYLKVNTGEAQTEAQNKKALEVERIYVVKEYHGKKVGQILYDKALEIAKKINAPYLWLGVWEENPRAINFYKKNGFVEFDKHTFKLGNDEQTDIMMKKMLSGE